jgi:hypothetical protein
MTSKPFSASPLALSKVPVLPEEEEWVIQRAQCAGKRREEKDMRDRLRDIGGGMSRFVKVGVGVWEEGRGKREEEELQVGLSEDRERWSRISWLLA